MNLNKLAFILFLACSTLTQSQGITDFFEDIISIDEIKKAIRNEIKNLEIETNVKLLDSQIADGVNLGIQYQYELEPSYEAGYYTRADSWKFNLNVIPSQLIRANNLPISLRFDPGAELFYVRQFKSLVKASTAAPYTPDMLPFTAAKALRNLEPGDFVSIPTHLNLVLSASMLNLVGGTSLGATSHFILSGKFMIHLFRLPNNKIRLKVIAQRTKSAGVNGDAQLDFQIFGIKLFNQNIESIYNVELGRFSSEVEWGDLFMFDYVIDLDKPEARRAYNQILSSTLKFKNLSIVNPFTENKTLENQIVTDLTGLDALYQKDLRKDNPAVLRLFKAKNEYKRVSNNFKVGLIVAKYQRNNIFTQNRVVSYDQDNTPQYYLFNNYTFLQDSKIFWGLFSRNRLFTVSTLLSTTEKEDIKKFSDLGISLDIRDSKFRHHEIREAMNHIKRNISNDLFQKIDFKDFNLVKPWQKVDQARIFYQIFFHQDALRYFMQYPTDKLRSKLELYLEKVPMPGGGYNTPTEMDISYNWFNWLGTYESAVTKFIKGLQSAFEVSNEVQTDQFQAFEQKIMQLRNNIVFQTVGSGFMIHLLPESQKADLVHINLVWDADKISPVRFEYGRNPKSQIYKNLEYIESTLNNRGYDLRLIEDQKTQLMNQNRIFNFRNLFKYPLN